MATYSITPLQEACRRPSVVSLLKGFAAAKAGGERSALFGNLCKKLEDTLVVDESHHWYADAQNRFSMYLYMPDGESGTFDLLLYGPELHMIAHDEKGRRRLTVVEFVDEL